MKEDVKTYVLMLSSVFPAGHPRAGEPTCFKDNLLVSKLHTIRSNADFWEHRVREINAGRGVLSVRQWSGSPFEPGSHQIEIARFTKLGFQRVRFHYYDKRRLWQVDVPYGDYEKRVLIERVAKKDGLDCDDFESWFGLDSRVEDYRGCILHFTDMRY